MLDLIREVQSGAVDPRNIGHEDRRACVGYLTAEGYAASEIAQILKTSDRTIHRDRERLRADHALQPSDELVGAMAGQLVSEAFTAIGRLRRLGRDKDAPHAARVEAEKAAWLVMKEMVQSLQRLGYLPLAVPSIKADFTHRMGAPELAEVGALQAELERLIEIKNSTGSGPPELESGIKEVQSVLLRLEAGQRLHELNHSVQSTEAHNESQHHP